MIPDDRGRQERVRRGIDPHILLRRPTRKVCVVAFVPKLDVKDQNDRQILGRNPLKLIERLPLDRRIRRRSKLAKRLVNLRISILFDIPVALGVEHIVVNRIRRRALIGPGKGEIVMWLDPHPWIDGVEIGIELLLDNIDIDPNGLKLPWIDVPRNY